MEFSQVDIYFSGRYYETNILNKSENATPELVAIYIQKFENQECN